MRLLRSVKSKLIPITVPVVILGGVAVFAWMSTPKSDVPVFEIANPGWGDLRVRLESEGSDVLLLTRNDPGSSIAHYRTGGVYRYGPVTETVTDASMQEWNKATGEVTYFGTLPPSFHWRRVGVKDGKILVVGNNIKSHFVETTGETALTCKLSLASDMVAVLTADGRENASRPGFFFPSGGGYRGQHYVELFRFKDMQRIRPAVRIPLTTAAGLDSAVWTADGRYVVYSSSNGKRVCIIRTDVKGD